MNAAQKLIKTMGQVAEALEDLKKTGLPRKIIVMALMEKTRLSENSIIKVLDAIEETARELLQPVEENSEVSE